MADIKLERIAQRLEAMQVKNDELREQLETRAGEKTEMLARHATEVTAHNVETTAMEKRRKELKDDYGDLFEIVGRIKKSTTPSE